MNVFERTYYDYKNDQIELSKFTKKEIEPFGLGQQNNFQALLKKGTNQGVAAVIVKYFPRERVEYAVKCFNTAEEIYDYVKLNEKKPKIKDGILYKMFCQLSNREIPEEAIFDMFALYPVETIQDVLDIQNPRLFNIDFVAELQKRDKKESIIKQEEEYEKKIAKKIKHEHTVGQEVSEINSESLQEAVQCAGEMEVSEKVSEAVKKDRVLKRTVQHVSEATHENTPEFPEYDEYNLDDVPF